MATPPYIVCPRCGRTSHNRNDIEQRFCGACHRFHDEPDAPADPELPSLLMVPPLQRGEFVTLTHEGRTVEGMVTLASGNGRSIIVMCDAIIAGFAGAVPLLEETDGWRTLNGAPVSLERITEPAS